jgi:hypothetical protein
MLYESSEHDIICMEDTGAFASVVTAIRENVPESEGFITSTSHDHTAVGTHGQVEDTVGMTG